MGRIKSISIDGFKSIKELKYLELEKLNVIVGANGAGKSNFIQIFRILDAMSHGRFQEFILKNGGADAFPFCGLKETPKITIGFQFTSDDSSSAPSPFYEFSMSSTDAEQMMLSEKYSGYQTGLLGDEFERVSLESAFFRQKKKITGFASLIYNSISQWTVYHFHDTGKQSPFTRESNVKSDIFTLYEDGRNLAAFLYGIRAEHPMTYKRIVKVIQSIAPYFLDFYLFQLLYLDYLF